MQEDIVKKSQPVERRRSEATWRKMGADQGNFFLKNCARAAVMMEVAASQRK